MRRNEVLGEYSVLIGEYSVLIANLFAMHLDVIKANIHMVSHVFHGFSKGAVIHQFEEIFFEVVLGGSSQIRIQTNIFSHPGFSLVIYSSMYLHFVAFHSYVVHNALCFCC